MPRSTVEAQKEHLSNVNGKNIFDRRFRTKKQEKRACLQCGESHDNVNGFCSVECCKIYKTKHPMIRNTKKKNLSRKDRKKGRL